MSIAENIKRLREQYGLTQRELGDIAGVSDKAVSTWELGTKEPRLAAIVRLAAHFGIPRSAIVDEASTGFAAAFDRQCAAWGRTPQRVEQDLDFPHARLLALRRGEVSPTSEELDRFSAYFGVPHAVLLGEQLPAEPANIRPLPAEPTRRIPVLGRIPAGTPVEAVEDVIGEIDLSARHAVDRHDYFALKVTGDSMFPEYLEGDVVVVRMQPTAETGDDVVAYIGRDDATLKRLSLLDDGIRLRPLNPAYPTRSFTEQEVLTLPVTIGGVVVELRRSKER